MIYTRVSTKDQADNNTSLETQKNSCEAFAERKGLEVIEYFGGTYESARSDERKEFNRMLSFVKRRKDISHIVVYSYDRFSRTGTNGAYITEQLLKQGVVTLAATQDIDVTSPTGTFQQNILYMFSHFDNQQRREKCMAGMREKMRKGYWAQMPPYGYTNLNPGRGKTPNYVINKEGKALKKAFEWKDREGLTHDAIAKRIHTKYGVYINPKKVGEYLRNPFYCGIITHSILNGEVVEGKHPPIVTKELFLRVNHKLNSFGGYGVRHSTEDEALPLKKFVRSLKHDQPYTGYLVKKKGLYYYRCQGQGTKENRSAKTMHRQFQELLTSYSITKKKLVKPLATIIERTLIKMTEVDMDENAIKQREVTVLKGKLERLEERFVFEEITRDQFAKYRSKLEDDISRIEQELSQEQISVSNLRLAVQRGIDYALNLPSLWESGDLSTKRSIQNMLFPDGILYDHENQEYRTTRVNTVFAAIAKLTGLIEDPQKEKARLSPSFSRLVAKGGIEPPTSGL